MKVKELIDILYEFDPDAEVLVAEDENGNSVVACADVTENIDHNCIIWP
jgi:hypothetical protein